MRGAPIRMNKTPLFASNSFDAHSLPSGVKVEVIMNMCIPIIECLLPGQNFTSTLLSEIVTILGIIWACKVFLDCFYNYIEKKQPSSRVEKIYVKRALLSL